jgi:hypothetical protein
VLPALSRQRQDPAAVAALAEDDRVHRDLYLDPDVFALEMTRIWSRRWIYVLHDSQLPRAGDALRVSVAGRDRRAHRLADGTIAVDGAAAVASLRGFVFCRVSDRGPSFEEWLGGWGRCWRRWPIDRPAAGCGSPAARCACG